MSAESSSERTGTVNQFDTAPTTTSGSLFPPPHLKASASELSEEASDAKDQKNSDVEEEQPVGFLPPPPDSSEDEAQKLDISEEVAKFNFDGLGPMVVNKDGTLSRIHNWPEMTEAERARTLKLLVKRNQLRMADIRGDGSGGNEQA